jgi:hypothetical protein
MSGNASGDGTARGRAEARYETCLWCKQRFVDIAEREVHISLLGSPGAFHRACFGEYTEQG